MIPVPRFSRQSLTYARQKGCNALGVLELAACMLPLLVQQFLGADLGPHGEPRGITALQRVLLPLIALAAAVFDVVWRWREEPDPRPWVKLTSADAGGALVWIPAWILWAALAATGIFFLIEMPHMSSPYQR
jgi:hypothetical protein